MTEMNTIIITEKNKNISIEEFIGQEGDEILNKIILNMRKYIKTYKFIYLGCTKSRDFFLEGYMVDIQGTQKFI